MSVTTSTAAPPKHQQTGLRKNHLNFLEVLAQSIGTIAPSGTPGLVIPVVFATAGNGTWLAYLFATVALFIVGLQINVFSRRVASPGLALRLCCPRPWSIVWCHRRMGTSDRLRVYGRRGH